MASQLRHLPAVSQSMTSSLTFSFFVCKMGIGPYTLWFVTRIKLRDSVCDIRGQGRCVEHSAQGLGLAPKPDFLLFSATHFPHLFWVLVFPAIKPQRASSSDLYCYVASNLPWRGQSPSWASVSSSVCLYTGWAGLDGHSGLPVPDQQSSPNICTKCRDTGQWPRRGIWLRTRLLLHMRAGGLPGWVHPIT